MTDNDPAMTWVHSSTVELVEQAVSDDQVVQAARVSTHGAMTSSSEAREGLIRHLMKNRHGSPFEHGMFTFRVTAPIFVFREWHRHRAGWSYNEESGRYKELEPVFYLPGEQRPLAQVGKAANYDMRPGTDVQRVEVTNALVHSSHAGWREYQRLLELGVAREVARMALTVNICSTMYATCNPRSLMHFLALRSTPKNDPMFVSHPMFEIAQCADRMEAHLRSAMPITWGAWNEFGRVAP